MRPSLLATSPPEQKRTERLSEKEVEGDISYWYRRDIPFPCEGCPSKMSRRHNCQVNSHLWCFMQNDL
jgi:hypothetical protein